jgi:DNA invertase Pin-like site-specific DNA recombinase
MVAFAYPRVSSDDQEKDGMSLPVQEKETLAYIAARESWTFGGSFQDVQTGANPTRAGYQRMLAAARAATAAGKRVAIVVVKQTRFGRDLEELARVWKELERLGAELHATRDGGLIANPLMYGIQALLAENDLRVISEGVRATFADIRGNGWLKPGRPRWGYRWEPATTDQRGNGAPMVVPVPHETEADYVRELFLRRAQGETIRALAIWVRSLPAEARGEVRRKDGSMRPRELSVSAVKDVLDSPVYIARNPDPDQDALDAPAGKWTPLCDDATWRAIHPRAGARENIVPPSARGEYALTGFLFCEACGARMCGQMRRGYRRARPGRATRTDPDKRIYICTSRMSGAASVVKPCYRTITAELIEGRIFAILTHLLDVLKAPAMRAAVRKAAKDLDERQSATGDARRLRNAEQKKQTLGAERIALTRALSGGFLTGEAYREAADAVTALIDEQAALIASLEERHAGEIRRAAERPQLDVILESAEAWYWAAQHGDVAAKRELLKLVLESATPRRIRAGEYTANPVWTPLGWHLLGVGADVLEGAGRREAVQLVWANCTVSTRPDATLAAAS